MSRGEMGEMGDSDIHASSDDAWLNQGRLGTHVCPDSKMEHTINRWVCTRCNFEFGCKAALTAHVVNGRKCTERRTGGRLKKKQSRTQLNGKQVEHIVKQFISKVQGGQRVDRAAKDIGHRLWRIVQWMHDIKLNFDYSSKDKLQPLWRRIGRSHRVSAEKIKNLHQGAGRPLGEPLATYGALLLRCHDDLVASPIKASLSQTLADFEGELASACGYLWSAKHEAKMSAIHRYLHGSENPSSGYAPPRKAEEDRRDPKMLTSCYIHQQQLEAAALKAGFRSFEDAKDYVHVVDECVVDRSGSIRRESKKTARGKHMFWSCLRGNGEVEFVILVPTDDNKLRWTYKEFEPKVLAFYTDYRYVNSSIYEKFVNTYYTRQDQVSIFQHDRASCHASRKIHHILESANYICVLPKLGESTCLVAAPDRPKFHGALKSMCSRYFCKQMSKEWKRQRLEGIVHPHIETLSARQLATFLSSFACKPGIESVVTGCIRDCFPRLPNDPKDFRHPKLLDVLKKHDVLSKDGRSYPLPKKLYKCERCGQEYATSGSAAARKHEDAATEKCYGYCKSMVVPCVSRGLKMTPPFRVSWNENGATKGALFIEELKTRPGVWKLKLDCEDKILKKSWSSVVKLPIKFEPSMMVVESPQQPRQLRQKRKAAVIGGKCKKMKKKGKQRKCDSSEDDDSADACLSHVRYTVDDDRLLESTLTGDDIDFDWPKLEPGEHCKCSSPNGIAFLIYSCREDENFDTVAKKFNEDASAAFKLTKFLNPMASKMLHPLYRFRKGFLCVVSYERK